MKPKDLVLKALSGDRTPRIPAGLHGWGMYKFALAGRVTGYVEEKDAWQIHGEELAKIESDFQERFQPDFMHMAEAFFESKKDIINSAEHGELLSAVRRLESEQVIDEFLDLAYEDADTLISQKKFDHLKILSEKYGREIFVFLETEGPVHDLLDTDGVLGFERGMMALVEKPKMLVYLMEGMFRRQLMYVEAVKRFGSEAYCQSESYFGADLVSPEMYQKYLMPIHQWFYKEVEQIGLVPIMNFWGYVTPIAKYLKKTNIRGLLIDESRKGYVLDVGEIKKELGPDVALFGNISAEHTLLEGTAEDVSREVAAQIEEAGLQGGFLSCCGPPVCFGTPVENVAALVESAKSYELRLA